MPKVVKQTPKPVAKKALSVLDRIEGIGADEEEGIKLNLYGKSGTGKTSLWATFPGPILAIICSGGSRPGELRSINTPEYRKKVKKVVLRASSEVTELAEYQEAKKQYNTLVLDHASGLQDLVLKEVLGLQELPAQLGWGVATQQQWGQVALQVKERLRSLLNLACNVVIVAQERDFNTDTESSELLMPYVASALTPSVVGWLNPACDYIAQTFIRGKIVEKQVVVGKKTKTVQTRGKGVDYCLRVAPHEVFTTKFRIPKGAKYPEAIVDPTYDKIVEIIKQGA